MRKIITALSLSLITLASFATASEAATRIKFARGSYCGSYSGNFSQGREFVWLQIRHLLAVTLVMVLSMMYMLLALKVE